MATTDPTLYRKHINQFLTSPLTGRFDAETYLNFRCNTVEFMDKVTTARNWILKVDLKLKRHSNNSVNS